MARARFLKDSERLIGFLLKKSYDARESTQLNHGLLATSSSSTTCDLVSQ
jgi:hypothetical protein